MFETRKHFNYATRCGSKPRHASTEQKQELSLQLERKNKTHEVHVMLSQNANMHLHVAGLRFSLSLLCSSSFLAIVERLSMPVRLTTVFSFAL